MSLSSFPHLESLIAEIRKAIDCELYYSAMAVTLTLPEICVALDLEDDAFVKQHHYVGFLEKYSTPDQLGVDGVECYRLRGGVIHRGNAAGHAFLEQDNIAITLPISDCWAHAATFRIDGSRTVGCLNLVSFVDAMVSAVCAWADENQNNPRSLANSEKMIRPWHGDLRPVMESGRILLAGPPWPY